ncbi:hypothetical protein CHS0354_028396 [Potamilus streckersoni]|uniref:Uncharacterized protein n=1 Tax=Potamilus streckersoni TaxID=2493646 RepID=A0AAE0VJ84_9BIVA|nr:hypothetical protein CHS0354_028396 [Potamilus streckersoni]
MFPQFSRAMLKMAAKMFIENKAFMPQRVKIDKIDKWSAFSTYVVCILVEVHHFRVIPPYICILKFTVLELYHLIISDLFYTVGANILWRLWYSSVCLDFYFI